MNKVKRYIPEKVYEKIQSLDYKNKEHLYIICDMVYRIGIFRKEDKDYSNKFTDIPSEYFTSLIQKNASFITAKSVLIESDILKCDGIYSKLGGKALGYKFSDSLISRLVSIDVEKKTISKRIISNRNDRNNAVNERLHKYRDYYLNTFKIDYEAAIKYLDNWYSEAIERGEEWIKVINKYNSIFMSLSAINDGDLYFRKNTTNGRIDTNLTSLKSEYKKFIISDDLYQIDIVNSQPFILYLYFNAFLCPNFLNDEEKRELVRYGDWTSSGMFYEMFEKTYFKKTGRTLSRKEIKDIMFCIFYSKNGSFKKEKNIFVSVFPNIMKWIEKEKDGKHNEFAIKLQRIESKICIDKICSVLDEEDIKYYTIHDAWLVSKKDIDLVVKTIFREFYNNLHRRPELKIEKI